MTEVEGDKQGQISFMENVTFVVKAGIRVRPWLCPNSLNIESVPWAGHMVFQKTLRRIFSRFCLAGGLY